MSDARGFAARAPSVDLGALWVAPPLIALAVLFLYPLALIAHAAVDDSGARSISPRPGRRSARAPLSTPCSTPPRSRSPPPPACLALGLALALILAFVPFPGARLVARLIDTVHRPADLPGRARLHLHLRLGRAAQRRADADARHHASRRWISSIRAWGVILAEVTVYTPFVLRPLLAALFADRAGADRGRQQPRRRTMADHPPDHPARRAAGAAGRRQPVPAADGQRVRHRVLHRRQGRDHPAAAGLRQGDPGIRLHQPPASSRWSTSRCRWRCSRSIASPLRRAGGCAMLVWSRGGRALAWGCSRRAVRRRLPRARSRHLRWPASPASGTACCQAT